MLYGNNDKAAMKVHLQQTKQTLEFVQKGNKYTSVGGLCIITTIGSYI